MRATRFGAIAQRNGGYIWDVFNIVTTYTDNQNTTTRRISNIGSYGTVYYANSYTFNASTGKYVLSSRRSVENNGDLRNIAPNFQNKYWNTGSTNSYDILYYSYSAVGTSVITVNNSRVPSSSQSKGTSTGTTVSSNDINAYPENGIQGDYWYVRRD